MNDPASDLVTWTRGRYWAAFFIALIGQVLLIYALSEHRPARVRQVGSSPVHHVVLETPAGAAITELLNLGDPTLFALPGWRGFSGSAWLRPPRLAYQSMDWPGPARWLTPNVRELGATFSEFVRTNTVAHTLFADKPAPRLSPVNPPAIPLPTRSFVRVEGELARRELCSSVEIPPVPHTDLLTNTVVQVGVNRSGLVLCRAVLSGSGSKAADQQAHDLAKTIRFNPLGLANPDQPHSLTWGRLVFQWHTVEPPANVPAPNPPL